MGLTGRTAKRRKRYYDWAKNDFGAIDKAYNLNIPADRFHAACEAYANMKVEEKRWRGVRGFFNALGKNPKIIIGLVVSVAMSVLSYGASSGMTFAQMAWAIGIATAAAAAASENARRSYSLTQTATTITSMRFTPSITSAAKTQQQRRSLNSLIFYAYANYPQGSTYEAQKLSIYHKNIPQQDIIYNEAYFGGRGIYNKTTTQNKINLNDTTQNRQGKNLAGGDDYFIKSVKNQIPTAKINNASNTQIRANSNRANARAQQISEGFQQLSNKYYNAGGQLLNDYEFILLRDISGFFLANITTEQREIIRNYNRGLRPYAPTIAADFQKLKTAIKTGIARLADLDSAIKKEAEAKFAQSEQIQSSDTTTLYEKANDYYFNCLTRMQNFLMECERDGDFADALILSGERETHELQIIKIGDLYTSNNVAKFKKVPSFAWILYSAKTKKMEEYGEEIGGGGWIKFIYSASVSAYAANESNFKDFFGVSSWDELEKLDKNELIYLYETFFLNMQIIKNDEKTPVFYNKSITTTLYIVTDENSDKACDTSISPQPQKERYYLAFVFECGENCKAVYVGNRASADFDEANYAEVLAEFKVKIPKSPNLNGYDYNKLDDDYNDFVIDTAAF